MALFYHLPHWMENKAAKQAEANNQKRQTQTETNYEVL